VLNAPTMTAHAGPKRTIAAKSYLRHPATSRARIFGGLPMVSSAAAGASTVARVRITFAESFALVRNGVIVGAFSSLSVRIPEAPTAVSAYVQRCSDND